jgi:hypothetical protein
MTTTTVSRPDPNQPLTPDQLALISLRCGAHSSREAGVCLLEAEAWAAGKPHTDSDVDVSPVLASFCRSLNDRLATDEERDLLKPLVFKLINTRRSAAIEKQRLYAIGDWSLRDTLPALLELAAVPELLPFAVELRALPAIVDCATTDAAREVIARARARALDLDLDLDRALARALDLDRARDRALDRALDLDLDLALALARALDLDRARALDLDRALALARALDLALALDRALDRDRARDRDLYKKNSREWREQRVRSAVVLITGLCEL